ncbi:MAG: flippase-like domain-containing protein [Candidatus Omnitrophica bacterium]|nr:flippase-like domain-containing protein [Candidatus Omnitrophota bacterium]
MKQYSRIFKTVFFVSGTALLIYTFSSIDIVYLKTLFSQLQFKLPAVLLMYPIFAAADVAGWQILFAPHIRRKIRFSQLYLIRMAGDSINFLTPFADVGGEYLKIRFCAGLFGISRRTAFANIFIERTALFLSEILFWTVGLAPLFLYLPSSGHFKSVLLITAASFSLLIAGLILLQRKGLFSFVMRQAKRFNSDSNLINRLHETSQDVDSEIRDFYQSQDFRWILSLLFHLLGWISGGVEMFVMMKLFGLDTSLHNAIILESLLQLIRTASFMIPGNIGAQEGGLALASYALGFDASVGVALSFIKRFRQLIFVAAGFLCIRFLDLQCERKAKSA